MKNYSPGYILRRIKRIYPMKTPEDLSNLATGLTLVERGLREAREIERRGFKVARIDHENSLPTQKIFCCNIYLNNPQTGYRDYDPRNSPTSRLAEDYRREGRDVSTKESHIWQPLFSEDGKALGGIGITNYENHERFRYQGEPLNQIIDGVLKLIFKKSKESIRIG